jgi:hypothetical protein
VAVQAEAARRDAGPNGPAEQRVRRYATRVTVVLLVLCSAVLLTGFYGSGVNLGRLVRVPERYNIKEDHCVRWADVKVRGETQWVRVCAEWLRTSDPSGETHKFQKETQVVKSADGKLYFDDGQLVDRRLWYVALFVIVVAAAGVAVRRYLVTRYRSRLLAGEPVGANHLSS